MSKSDIENNEIIDFVELDDDKRMILEMLIKNHLASIYENPVYIDKYRKNSIYFDLPQNTKFLLNTVYLQITNQCNLKCINCGKDIIWQACNSCERWVCESEMEKTEIDQNYIINEIVKFKPSRIIFSGGNPLIEDKRIEELIRLIIEKSEYTNIYIVTNGTLPIKLSIDVLEEINLQIVLIGNPFIDTERMYNKKERDILKANIENLIKINVKLNYVLHGKYWNNDTINSITKYIATNDVFETKCFDDYVVEENKINPPSKITANEFFCNMKDNICLNNTIAINFNGDVLPCPFIYDKIGNLYKDTLTNILKSDKRQRYWGLTKDKISNNCSTCGFRFSCTECAVVDLYFDKHYSQNHGICSINKGKKSK